MTTWYPFWFFSLILLVYLEYQFLQLSQMLLREFLVFELEELGAHEFRGLVGIVQSLEVVYLAIFLPN